MTYLNYENGIDLLKEISFFSSSSKRCVIHQLVVMALCPGIPFAQDLRAHKRDVKGTNILTKGGGVSGSFMALQKKHPDNNMRLLNMYRQRTSRIVTLSNKTKQSII